MAESNAIVGSIAIVLYRLWVVLSTAYENLEKHVQLAMRQLKEIKDQKKKFDAEELISLESQITDLITDLVNFGESE